MPDDAMTYDTQPVPVSIEGAGLDFVTVIFRTELEMLRLQARSMARFLNPEDVNSILIILNDEDEDACRAGVEAMVAEWGALAKKLQIIPGSVLVRRSPTGLTAGLERFWVGGPRCVWRPFRDRVLGRPRVVYGWARNNGWLTQQAFKLLAVYRATGRYVVILDAKNFFIRKTDATEFVDAEGRPRVEAATQSPKYIEWAECSAKRLGFPVPNPTSIPPSLTPVVHRRETMMVAVKELETKLGLLESFFVRRSAKSTEFMLLYAAMSGESADWMAGFSVRQTPPIYRISNAQSVKATLDAISEEPRALLSFHRKHFRELDPATKDQLTHYLRKIGLLGGDEAAEGFSHA